MVVHGDGGTRGKENVEPLCLICGGGALPFAVADMALQSGRPVFLLAIAGWADRATVARYPHAWAELGQYGRMKRLARAAGCRDVVCIGTLTRPSLRAMRLDWAAIRHLPRLYRLFRGGDDHLLSGIKQILEEDGFRMLGAHEVAPNILAPTGLLGSRSPPSQAIADAERGFALLEAIGRFDVGQAAVVADNRVLAIEAADGTDAMLAHLADMRRQGRIRSASGAGVLVKGPKPAQEQRMDLPAVGPETITGVRQAGLGGIALRAGGVLVAEPDATIAAADAAGVFLLGLPAAGG